MNKSSCIYVTYDINFHKYLKEKGIMDLIYGLHPKTKCVFWVYERNERFNIELKKWYRE